jgi:hypothetical protein
MAPERRTQGLVYRWGKRRIQDFTPRPKVVEEPNDPNRLPGLSTSDKVKAGKVNQVIDLALLKAPLQAFADAPHHVSIVPVDETGVIDKAKLAEWASYRDAGECHELTQILLDAIVDQIT